jgi:CheY-like chemotaxis protein
MTEASILFVDDDASVLSSMRRMLHPMRSQWRMAFATSGDEAMEMLSMNAYDVVVSDMRMPGMNGAQLLTRVRARHRQQRGSSSQGTPRWHSPCRPSTLRTSS